MSPQPINGNIVYPGHIETSSPVIFGKSLVLTELKYFQQGPRSPNQFRNLTYEIPYWKYRDGYVISGFSSNPYKLN